MSGKPVPNQPQSPSMPVTVRDEQSARWRRWLAAVWLVAFTLYFYSFTLPNNPETSRPDLWKAFAVPSQRLFLPLHLLDVIDPADEPDSPPAGWQYIPQRFDLLATAAIILAGAWGLGHLILRLLRPPLDFSCPAWPVGRPQPNLFHQSDTKPARGAQVSIVSSTERTVFAFALGMAAMSLLTLACGLAGGIWLSRQCLGGLMAAGFGLELWIRRRQRMRHRSDAIVDEGGQRPARRFLRSRIVVPPLAAVCLFVMTPFLLAMLLGSMLPSYDFDVKEYHLQGPKEFYQNGRISFLPHNVYTSFPFLTEMLSLLAMVLRDDWYRGALAGKAVLMCFAPLTALALYAAGRRWFGPHAGWLAALIYLTTPWTYRISIIAYAEGGLSFYLFVALLAVMIGIEKLVTRSGLTIQYREGEAPAEPLLVGTSARREPRPPGFETASPDDSSTRQFLLAGLLAGCAMACKYTGLLMVVIPLGVAVCAAGFVLKLGESRRQIAIRSVAGFAIGTLLAIGPWLLKNAIQTGNPVYPLLYSVFGGEDWDAQLDAKWRAGHSPDNHSPGDLVEKLRDVTAKSDWLSPLLFGLAPLTLLVGSRFKSRQPFGRGGTEVLPAQPSSSIAHRRDAGATHSCADSDDVVHCQLIRWLWLYVLFLFLAWWTFTHRIDRFWVPMIPVVSLLAGVGAVWSYRQSSKLVSVAVIAAAVFYNLGFITTGLCGYNAYLIDLDHARRRAESSSAGMGYLNRLFDKRPTRDDFKVLCVGEAQVFDARFPLVYNTVFDRSIFQQWCAVDRPNVPAARLKLRDPRAIRQRLKDAGITHVFVNWAEILRYRTTYGYTDFVAPWRFQQLVQAGVLDDPTDLSFRDPETLSESERREVNRWAPELLRRMRGKTVLTTSQIFRVAR